jgi:AcrR family transcriptional regulator
MTEPTASTTPLGKDALLDAASALFDEVGIDAVALNEIVRASGHRNRSAILYHFGSKDDVVRAVVERSMVSPDARRSELLDDLLVRDPQPGTVAIAEVVVQPLTELLDTADGRRHLRLLGQLLSHPRLLASAQAALRGNGSLARSADLVTGELTHLPSHLRQERVALLVAFVMRAYADQARLLDAVEPSRQPLSGPEFTAHVVGLIEAILGAPDPAST